MNNTEQIWPNKRNLQLLQKQNYTSWNKPHAFHYMNLLNWSFTWSRLQDLLIICLLCIHARTEKRDDRLQKTWSRRIILGLIKFFKKNQPGDCFCRMYKCRLESYWYPHGFFSRINISQTLPDFFLGDGTSRDNCIII